MKAIYKLFILSVIAILALSCNNKAEPSDLEKLRNSTNAKTYPVNKMDSLESITAITQQKVQELLDLSTLYTSGNRDTEIDSVIYAQMEGYFIKPDSLKLKALFQNLDSLKVKSAKVNRLDVVKRINGKDTVDFANFNIEYFDTANKSIGSFDRQASFVLKQNPIKFKKEFKFYFLDFYSDIPKDSTSIGVTR